jgi:transcriptional regulator with XRE-family HTH domain
MSLIDALGQAIKTERRGRNISQEKLAARAGVHRTYLSDVERGIRNPSINTIEKLAQGLGIPVFSLFTPQEKTGEKSDGKAND